MALYPTKVMIYEIIGYVYGLYVIVTSALWHISKIRNTFNKNASLKNSQ